MTLLDAPEFDEAKDRRQHLMLYSAAGLLYVYLIS